VKALRRQASAVAAEMQEDAEAGRLPTMIKDAAAEAKKRADRYNRV
jgi:hypothetical protein